MIDREFTGTEMRTRNFAWWVIILLGGGMLLYLGRPLFIPLAFAMLISFVLYPMCRWLEGKGVNRVWAIVLMILLLTLLLFAVVSLLVFQFKSFGTNGRC
jgi:predicted PurR-regulated permease PerM